MKPIPIKELLLNQKRLDEITKVYSSLSELEVILDRVEVGGFKSQEKNKCIVKCIEIERNKKDKGCMWATFYFMGYKVRMGFVKDSFCYISTIEFEDIKFNLSEIQKLNYQLSSWKPKNEIFWYNIAIVFEVKSATMGL